MGLVLKTGHGTGERSLRVPRQDISASQPMRTLLSQDAVASLAKIQYMTKTIIPLFLAIALMRCASEPSEMTGEPGRLLVSIEFPEDSLSAIIFKYNEAGDIAQIFNTTDTALYEYKGDSILLSWIDGMSHTIAMQKFSTGPDGKIRTNHIFDPSGKLFAITTYTYNAGGQVTEQVRRNAETDDAFKMSYSYDGDNLRKIVVYKNDMLMDMFTYEYDPKALNMFEVDIDNLLNDTLRMSALGRKTRT